MAFRVEITPRAEADLWRIWARVMSEAPYYGPPWFTRFRQAIESLAQFPDRCPAEPMLSTAGRTVRVLLFGRNPHAYRVYFATYDDEVRVLHVRHGARREPRRL